MSTGEGRWTWPPGRLRVAAICGRKVLLDNWTVRRWLLWPWCLLRRHRDEFWLAVRWNGVTTEEVARCTCGRRVRRYPVSSSGSTNSTM